MILSDNTFDMRITDQWALMRDAQAFVLTGYPLRPVTQVISKMIPKTFTNRILEEDFLES